MDSFCACASTAQRHRTTSTPRRRARRQNARVLPSPVMIPGQWIHPSPTLRSIQLIKSFNRAYKLFSNGDSSSETNAPLDDSGGGGLKGGASLRSVRLSPNLAGGSVAGRSARRACEQITFNAETAERRNAQGFLSVLCERC